MKHLKSILLLFFIFCFLVACTAKTPSQFLSTASSKAGELKNYTFEINAQLSAKDTGDTNLKTQDIFTSTDGMNFTVKGKYDLDQEKMEAIITLAIAGDIKFSLDIPILLDKRVIYIKIPNTSPLFELPEQLVGKYIVADLNDISENYLDLEIQDVKSEGLEQAVFKDLIKLFIAQYGDSEYLSLLGKDHIPTNKDVTQALQFKLTQSNFNPFMQKLQNETLPKAIEILKGHEQYLKQYDISVPDLDDTLVKLKSQKNIADEISDFGSINEITYITGLDKSNFMNYQSLIYDTLIKQDGFRDEHIVFNISSHLTNINKEQNFELNIPSVTDTINIEDLLASPEFLYFFYGFGGYDDNLDGDINWDENSDLDFSSIGYYDSFPFVDMTPNKFDFESQYGDETFWDEFGNLISKDEYLNLYGDNQLRYDENNDIYYDDYWNALIPK